MTGRLWMSGFIAALFALHPLHVESVAWVAERKDVLSTFFWMLTMWIYMRYVEGPGLNRYLLVLLSFTLGLLSKPMLVTLPFVLLLLDYWPLGRFQFGQLSGNSKLSTSKLISSSDQRSVALRLVWEKAPFFLLSALSSILTIFAAQRAGAVASLEYHPFESRFANALVSYYSGHKESNNLHRDIVILRVLRGAELTSQSAFERNIQPAWQSLKLLTRRYLNSGRCPLF